MSATSQTHRTDQDDSKEAILVDSIDIAVSPSHRTAQGDSKVHFSGNTSNHPRAVAIPHRTAQGDSKFPDAMWAIFPKIPSQSRRTAQGYSKSSTPSESDMARKGRNPTVLLRAIPRFEATAEQFKRLTSQSHRTAQGNSKEDEFGRATGDATHESQSHRTAQGDSKSAMLVMATTCSYSPCSRNPTVLLRVIPRTLDLSGISWAIVGGRNSTVLIRAIPSSAGWIRYAVSFLKHVAIPPYCLGRFQGYFEGSVLQGEHAYSVATGNGCNRE